MGKCGISMVGESMNIHELLNIKVPILQGAMAHITDGAFAAAVSKAGALGTIGTGAMSPEDLRREVAILRELTDKPFAVNIVLLHPKAKELAEVAAELKVPVVTTGAGNPSAYIQMWKEAGCKVIPVVGSVPMGKRMASLGVDALIAEGNEAGGHVGEMTTMTFIPALAKEVSLPLIAAGGIASGRQMAAAQILGAQGVQMGTAFLVTKECPIHENYKQKILQGKSSKVGVIGHAIGMPMRLMKNTMSRNYSKKEKEGWNLEQLESFTSGALRRAVKEGDTSYGALMSGLCVAQLEEEMSVEQWIQKVMKEYKEIKL